MADSHAHPLNPRAYLRHAIETLRRDIEKMRGSVEPAPAHAKRLALAEHELRIVEAELGALEPVQTPHRRRPDPRPARRPS